MFSTIKINCNSTKSLLIRAEKPVPDSQNPDIIEIIFKKDKIIQLKYYKTQFKV